METNKVIYYTGCMANYSTTRVGEAAINTLEINGLEVILLEEKCCGMSMAKVGRDKAARKNAEFNVESLSRLPYDIVTTCPTCTAALKQEFVHLLGSPQAEAVSHRTYDIIEYLYLMYKQGKMNTDFRPCPKSVIYHIPCHLRSQGDESFIESRIELLGLIPELSIKTIDRCCGMGGTQGIKNSFYKKSMQIGASIFDEIKEDKPDYVLDDCTGCSMQIEAGSGYRVEHPIVFLYEAYAKENLAKPSLATAARGQ